MRHDTDAVSPWSFFLPVLLAVVCGTLVADGLQRVFLDDAAPDAVAVSVDDAAVAADVVPVLPEQAEVPSPPQPTPTAMPATELSTLPPLDLDPDAADLAQPVVVAAPVQDPVIDGSEVDADGTPRLPGPISARRSGAPRSCINNTVADRSPNGWEQALENDAPVRCSASSQ